MVSFVFCSFAFKIVNENEMKRKFYIFGVLAALCLLGTGYYAWTLYNAHCKQVAEWNEGAKAAFEEALWMEVNKRAKIPIYTVYSEDEGRSTLNERIPKRVSVMTEEGVRNYKIDRDKYENSLIKETKSRGDLSALLRLHSLSVDTLAANWDSLSRAERFSIRTQIRHIYTDFHLNNDTVFSIVEKRYSRLDSLTMKYLGYRCEHEVTAYVSYPYWTASITSGDGCILLLPWLLLVLLFVCYPKLEALAKRKLIHKEVIEKTIEIEREVIVEKEMHVADITIDKAQVYQLPGGGLFDSFSGTITKSDFIHTLPPQSALLLKLFLRKENHHLSISEIDEALWEGRGSLDRIHKAIQRLRIELKKVSSDLVIKNVKRDYELK